MKHTTATNAASWQTADNMVTVYTNPSYQPQAGGYDMLQLSTPFLWNGVDNLVIDTAFSMVPAATAGGSVQYTPLSNSYIFAWSNFEDQTDVFTGGRVVARRPNIMLGIQSNVTAPNITVNTTNLNFGAVEIGQSSSHNITLSNTAGELLAGYITLPEGYGITSVRELGTGLGSNRQNWDRSTLRFTLDGTGSLEFTVSFTPIAETSYNGNLVITSNAVNQPTLNVGLTGSGMFPSLATPALSINGNGANLNLSWNAVPNATAYKVYRAFSPEGPYSLIGSTSLLQFSDPGTAKAFYYIKATNTPTRN